MDPAEEETIVQTPAYRIGRRRADDFLLVRISGRCADGLLDDLRSKVFLYRANYALDLSGLAGISAALARELQDTAESFRSGEKRLVLVQPPQALRTLLALGGRASAVEIVQAEDQLHGPVRKAEEGGGHALKELERIRKELQTNRHWQFVDRAGVWICPFCAALQKDVQVTSALAVASATVEKAYRHLWFKCPSFVPTAPRLRPLAELQDALRRANQETVIVETRRLNRLETELTALKGKASEFEESVRRASERQRRLLPPSAPEVPGAEIDLIYRPASVVSGDFYDFVALDEGRVAFIVGDVSGHGIEAGIVMGMAKKVLAIRLQDYPDPVDALVRVNEDVDRELGRVSFVTAFVGIYDPAARILSSVRAGHNPPLLYNPKREGRCLRLEPPGMGLGIVDQRIFEPALKREEIAVQAGDVLLLYTDGLVEAHGKNGEEFGVERTIQVLAASYGYTPALILSQLAGTLDGFTGAALSEDDITAICVRFR